MIIGITYLPHEVTKLQLDPDEAMQGIVNLGCEVVRLGVRWNEIQPTPQTWNFGLLLGQMEWFQRHNIRVILSIGMKAPRWPEYYLPEWIKVAEPQHALLEVLKFIARTIKETRTFDNIYSWQVENEPLDRGGRPHWVIPLSMLEKEITLVRSLDPRPIHLNFWGNNIIRRQDVEQATKLADSIGVDLYYRQPTKWRFFPYLGPYFWDWQLRWWMHMQSKPVWITELQADAWESSHEHKWQAYPGSINPDKLRQNFNRAVKLNPKVLLFWGYEYWLWHKQQGRPELFEAARELVASVK